jgi:HEAT repeat protein
LNALGSPAIEHRVIPLLDHADPGVREAAVRISGYFGYRQCVDSLFARCEDADENVRRAAIEHIPYLNDSRAPGVLSRALQEDVSGVRAMAAAAMAHLDPSQSIPCLIAALDDTDPWVRYFAARSLDRHRAADAAPALHRIAESDRFPQVRIAALEALSSIDRERAYLIANSFMTSTDVDLQHAADLVLAARGQS